MKLQSSNTKLSDIGPARLAHVASHAELCEADYFPTRPGQPRLQKMKLLIVEDHPAVRKLIRSIVHDLADDIRECNDGSDALAAYAEFSPDVVLMDIEMKKIDGISASGLIRKANPHARVIMVTNYDDPALREAAALAGACGYVLKRDLLDLRRILLDLPS